MKSISAFLFCIVASVASLESSVTVQRDGTAVTREWSLSCASVDEPTVATFTIELKTQSSFSTYSVDITSKFESTAVSSSEEVFGDLEVTTGGGDSFTGLAVGEVHELPIRYTYLSTGSRSVELTATIKTGDWNWPDREEFTETINVLIEEDGCTSPYAGLVGTGGGVEPDEAIVKAGRDSAASTSMLSLVVILGSCVAYWSL